MRLPLHRRWGVWPFRTRTRPHVSALAANDGSVRMEGLGMHWRKVPRCVEEEVRPMSDIWGISKRAIQHDKPSQLRDDHHGYETTRQSAVETTWSSTRDIGASGDRADELYCLPTSPRPCQSWTMGSRPCRSSACIFLSPRVKHPRITDIAHHTISPSSEGNLPSKIDHKEHDMQ